LIETIDVILNEIKHLNIELKNAKIPAKDIRQMVFNYLPYGNKNRIWKIPKKYENTNLNILITYIWIIKYHNLYNTLFKFNANIMTYGLEKASYNYLIRYQNKLNEDENIEEKLLNFILNTLNVEIINKYKCIHSDNLILEYEIKVTDFFCENSFTSDITQFLNSVRESK